MEIRLSGQDRERMAELVRIQESNARALQCISMYLTRRPCWVEATDVDAVAACGVTEEQAFTALMTAGMGLDEQDSPADRALVLDYIAPSVKKLDLEIYRNDPYFRNIRVPEKALGRWTLGRRRYRAYEAFVRNDLRLCDDFREIPQIGFFGKEFTFPAVLENGNEWMTVTPNEVETMKEAIGQARGRVAPAGWGWAILPIWSRKKRRLTA